jgi:hypothetical protein
MHRRIVRPRPTGAPALPPAPAAPAASTHVLHLLGLVLALGLAVALPPALEALGVRRGRGRAGAGAAAAATVGAARGGGRLHPSALRAGGLTGRPACRAAPARGGRGAPPTTRGPAASPAVGRALRRTGKICRGFRAVEGPAAQALREGKGLGAPARAIAGTLMRFDNGAAPVWRPRRAGAGLAARRRPPRNRPERAPPATPGARPRGGRARPRARRAPAGAACARTADPGRAPRERRPPRPGGGARPLGYLRRVRDTPPGREAAAAAPAWDRPAATLLRNRAWRCRGRAAPHGRPPAAGGLRLGCKSRSIRRGGGGGRRGSAGGVKKLRRRMPCSARGAGGGGPLHAP